MRLHDAKVSERHGAAAHRTDAVMVSRLEVEFRITALHGALHFTLLFPADLCKGRAKNSCAMLRRLHLAWSWASACLLPLPVVKYVWYQDSFS